MSPLNESQKKDCKQLLKIFKDITKEKPSMWGEVIIGFGSYMYTNTTAKPYEWFHLGFSPRKNSISIYLMPGYQDLNEDLQYLGKHKMGKCCLSFKNLETINIDILKQIITKSHRLTTK